MKRAASLFSCLGLAVGLVSAAAYAETLKMNPGNWESTITIDNPFTGKQTTTQTQCMEEDEFDPQSMLQGQDDCSLLDQSISGNTLSFTMECKAQGTTSTMQGEMSIDDDEGSGNMAISMEVAGQKFDMKMDFTSRRLGDC